ncbi:50S ribosomal protein L2 [bacterium]|nr:50S ribosomal protein L2 [bacterium]
MVIRRYNPTNPSRRGTALVVRSDLAKKPGGKGLRKGASKSAGRNAQGKITVRHRGGGHKRSYRSIDFRRTKRDVPGRVVQIEYDPNRTAFIALISYLDGEKRYILAPTGLKAGDEVIAGEKVPNKPGNAMPLRSIRAGSFVYAVELRPGQGGILARSAGSHAILKNKEGRWAVLQLPSGELRRLPIECWASVGRVSNTEHNLEKIGKAGRNRWKGKRPSVRGLIMNPVDHPNGGGEGRSKGKILRTPWGKVARGPRTRKEKPSDQHIVRSRRARRR